MAEPDGGGQAPALLAVRDLEVSFATERGPATDSGGVAIDTGRKHSTSRPARKARAS